MTIQGKLEVLLSERRNDVFTAGRGEVLSETSHIEGVPIEMIPLPSQGKVYPPDSPLHSKVSIDIKSMTAKEEDILSSRALMKKGTVIDELLRSCIHTPGINVDEMLAGDRNAVMVGIRITGYGREYSAQIQCQGCSEKIEAEFDLASLSIKRLDIEPCVTSSNLFEFSLPRSGKKVVFKFLTGADERDLLQEAERRKKVVGLTVESNVTGKLLRSIVSIDGVTDRNRISAFVRSMPAADSRALRKYMDSNEPGIDMTTGTVCPLCGEHQEVEMPIGVRFFWPDA